MKAIVALVALSVAGIHIPADNLEVKPDEGTISGTVNSFTDEAASQVAGATPLKTSPFTCPTVSGQDDADTVNAYLTANIATVVGGTLIPSAVATAPATSEGTAQAQ